MQRPIRFTVVYTCASLRSLRLNKELPTLKECKKNYCLERRRTVIFQIGEDRDFWFVSKSSFKYRQLSGSGTEMPVSRKSVIMYSSFWASLFVYIWTGKDVQRACQTCSVPISANKALQLPINMSFPTRYFRSKALPDISLISSEHDKLGQPRTQGRNAFT